jgi:hypothetical protein
MPALSFYARFAPLVESGHKRQTIRTPRRHPIRPGDQLKLYTGMRTAQCRRLATVVCQAVFAFRLQSRRRVWYEPLGWLDAAARERFARDDGFADWAEMFAWFEDKRGLPFHGIVIRW